MKTENFSEMTDGKSIGMKNGIPEQSRESGFLIPAGILIGLGAGLLLDQAVAGFLVGLGTGLLGSELFALARKPREGECLPAAGVNVTLLVIGAVFTLAGISIVWTPAAVWIYAIPGLMILAGIGFLVRGFAKSA